MNYCGDRLRLARLLNAKTLVEVAEQVGESKQKIHKLENKQACFDRKLALSLASALGVSVDFFEPTMFGHQPIVTNEIHFRATKSRTKQSDKDHDAAKVIILDEMLSYIENELDFPCYDIPNIATHSDREIEEVAMTCRAHWGLGDAPISNMIRVLENAGVVVLNSNSLCQAIDGASVDNNRPKVLRNTPLYGYRSSFTDAHELGHLVMHKGIVTGDRETERQANRFASAFLLPARAFYHSFPKSYRINWTRIEQLKQYWGVSKSALFYRAKQVGVIDDKQYLTAIKTLNNKGERQKERGDEKIVPECPELFPDALRYLANTRHWDSRWWEKELGISAELLETIIGSPLLQAILSSHHIRSTKLRVVR